MANELTNEIRLTAIDSFNALKPTQVIFGVYMQPEQKISVEQQLKIPLDMVKIPKHLQSGLQDRDTVILLQNLGANFFVLLGVI